MNSHRVVNLAAPVDDNDAVRLVDILDGTVVDDIVETILINRLLEGDGITITIADGNATLELDDNYTKNLIGGILLDTSSVDLSYDPVNRTISATVVTEAIQDIVGALISSSDNFVTVTYNDGANTLVLTEGSGVPERIRDVIGTALQGTTDEITVTVNDGADTITLSLPAAQKKIRLGFFFGGLHTNDEIMARYVAVSDFDLPASLTGSYLKAATAATGSTTFSLKKNGVEFATCLVSAAGTTGAFTAASLTSFAAGDVLSIHAPATADATLADVGLTLIGDLT